MRKYFISGGVLMTGCSLFLLLQSFFLPHSFEKFTMDIFRHELSGDTLNLHYTLTDPDSFGIEETSPSFGALSYDTMEEEIAYLNKCQEKLSLFQKTGLSDENQLTAEILDWWLTGQLISSEYYYYQEPLGPTLGIQAQLPVLLAEFPLRNQTDINTYLELLATLPEYFKEIADFEKEKSAQGLFMNDEILDKILTQCRSLFPIDENHFLVTTFQERLKDCDFLSSDQKITYEIYNLSALTRYVQTAYEDLCQSMEKLRGTGTNAYGLYYFPEGIKYYESLLRYSIGTDRTMADIQQLLEEQMESDYETILYALHQGIKLLEIDDDAPAQEHPTEILTNLRTQIREDFPETHAVSWQIKQIPDSLMDFLSPAFYMTPAIDAEEQNTIYINPSYAPDRTELITTLAHEGYPGHLYQNSFENTDSYDPIRNLIYIGGYTEGWGLYSEFYAYDLLGLSDVESDFLRALSSLNYAICASLDLAIHGEGWTEEDCLAYLSSFGITDESQTHELYLNILEEPSNYLKYYLGYLEICKLKESALTLSSIKTLYDFHKWFLEMGPAPFSVLEKHLEILEISSQFFQGTNKDVHLFTFKSIHDSLHHLLMEARMLFVSGNPLLCQGEKYNTLILCTADTGHIPFFHQTVDGGG